MGSSNSKPYYKTSKSENIQKPILYKMDPVAPSTMPSKMVLLTEEARSKDPHFEVSVGVQTGKKQAPVPKAPTNISASNPLRLL